MKHFHDFTSPTGVEHRIHVSDDELITEEFTSTKIEKIILDKAHELRALSQSKEGFARHAAIVPVGRYWVWRKEWLEKYRQNFSWATFETMKINSSDYANLRTGVKKL